MRTIPVIALALLTAACGTSTSERASTGALTGVGVGAAVGGPVGAAVGAAVGGLGGTAAPEGADQAFNQGVSTEKQAFNEATGRPTRTASARNASEGSSGAPHLSRDTVRQAQDKLAAASLYNGPIDGIVGNKTRTATRDYQREQGLPQTAQLDSATLQHLNVNASASGMSGSSTNPAASGGKMSTAQIQQHLQSAGYSNISDVRQYGDNAYTARAMQGGTSYVVDVDAKSGQVTGRQQVSANTGSSMPSGSAGSSTAPGNPNAQNSSMGTSAPVASPPATNPPSNAPSSNTPSNTSSGTAPSNNR